MERSVEVSTGESVAFRYELAGLGSRFLAVFIDMTIQFAVLFGIVAAILWLVPDTPAPKLRELDKFAGAVATGIIVFALFMLFFGYFIAFEWLWQGRTPGKRALGIRVVREGGFPLDFVSSTIRNTVRVLEFGLCFYLVSAIVTLLSSRNQRLGDMAAGSLVVRDRRYDRVRALGSLARERDDAVVRELTPAERELVRSFAERAPSLARRSRRALAARIAGDVRPKLSASFAYLDDEALLAHLADSAL